MDRPRYDRLKTLFARALALRGAERRALIEAVRTKDAELGRKLDQMLSADEDDGFILPPCMPGVAPAVEAETDLLAGTRMGAYVVERRMASGGMGDVYLAHRDDQRFQRRVAIKVLKAGLDTRFFLERFGRERQALAALTHRYIVQLLDAGSLEDGRPYLVLEHVEGLRIDRYCDQNGLGLAERLALFVKTCEAVSFAHSRLTVHGDLKPSNILVAENGEPRLLDFGIARMLPERDAAEPDLERAPAMEPFTPDYASPEQIRGARITTATDVYALGRLLGMLCAGADRSGMSGLPRDLQAVVAMAVREDPTQRHASAADLAEDVERFATHRPVHAREPTLLHRARLWVRRNRLSAAVGVLSAGMLVAAFSAVVRGARMAERQRALAEQERAAAQDSARLARAAGARSERVTEFLKSLLAAPDPYGEGAPRTLPDLLTGASERIDTEFEADPAIAAELRTVIGRTLLRAGLLREANAELERAVALRRELFGEGSPLVAETLSELGAARYEMSDWDGAIEAFEQALVIRERLSPHSLDLARVLNDLGVAQRARWRFQEAEGFLRDALDLRRELAGPRSVEVAESLTNLGSLMRHRGDADGALELAYEALEIRERLLAPGDPLLAQARSNLAMLLAERGALDEAIALMQLSLESVRTSLGSDHVHVAQCASNLGMLLLASQRPVEAEPLLRECHAIRTRRLSPDDFRIARAAVQLGYCLSDQDRHAEALSLLRPGLVTYEERLAADDPQLGELRVRTARSQAALSR